MTLPHLAGIFTNKQLAETAREQLQAAGQMVTMHRMDLIRAPPGPVTGNDGQPVILPPGPCRIWVVRTRYPAPDNSQKSDKN